MMVRIAIPLAEGKLCLHFGNCRRFALVEADPEAKRILSTTTLNPPPHEPGVLPAWLKAQGTDVVLAGGMGGRARGLFEQAGIEVVVGAPCETPGALVDAYLSGTLKLGANVCAH